MKKIDDLLVTSELTLRTALKRLDRMGLGILLLVDGRGQLLRTVTDGDIRRALLSGFSLDTALNVLTPQKPITVGAEVKADQALAIMSQYKINHIPVIDGSGQPIDLLTRGELSDQILLSTPHLGDFERDYVTEAFETNWIAPLGPNVDAFEREIAEYVDIAGAAAVNSGTAALHLALRLIGVRPDDTVFCSSFTFVASASPILYQGATPVFIDSEPSSWNMSPAALERALTSAKKRKKLPRAVVVVNIYGQSADLDSIIDLCGSFGVPVIEDAAESLGATYKGKASGTLGRIGIYSFNGNKIITTSGGGMIVSEDTDLIEKARFLSTQGRDPAPYYQHSELAYNYRMSNVLAGIGRGQLKVLDERVAARRRIFDRYVEGLKDVEAISWMPEAGFGKMTRWLTALTIDPDKSGLKPLDVVQSLSKYRIEARPVWKPMHQQPLFKGSEYFAHADDVSVSDHLFGTGLCLPSGSNMTLQQQDQVIDAIHGLFP